MNLETYNQNVVLITYLESLKIFFFSLIWGSLTLFKRFTLKLLRSQKCDWNDRDNPPSFLVDNKYGRHSYMKIKGKGIKLHYVEAGEKANPPLILLHGFPDCWITWFNQIPVLAQHFRVIALDLKGFGDSDKPQSRRSYKLSTLLEELSTFLESLGIVKCVIVGHDIGALLGWYLAHLHTDLVIKFVAISSPHPNVYWKEIPKNSKFNHNWIQFSQLPILPELDVMKNDLSIIDECFQHLTVKNKSSDYIDAYKYAFSRIEDWNGAINYFRNLPFYRLQEKETIEEIDVKCLLITGKQDQAVPLESIVKSTEYVQKYFLKVIDGAGHYPHQENPEKVNKALLEFLVDVSVLRAKREVAPPPGLIGKMMGSLPSMKFGHDMLSGMKKGPTGSVSTLLSKTRIHFGLY